MSSLLAETTDCRPRPRSTELHARVSVLVFAKDPISRAGVNGQLRADPDICVLEPGECCHADVGIVVVDALGDDVLRLIRTIRRSGLSRILVIAGTTDPASVTALSEAGANGLLPRLEADRGRLTTAIRDAHRDKQLLPALPPLPALPAVPTVDAMPAERGPSIEPQWGTTDGEEAPELSERGREVLRLLADGCDTSEIARRMAYSEPTIKNVIQRLFEQLKARNRPHAVAVALRSGLI